MVEADHAAKWPSERRLSGSLLSTAVPFMPAMDFELLTLDQISGKVRSEIADLETLVLFARTPSTAVVHRVYAGNNIQGPFDLPWLDVERALVIGGGADYGDDTWISLDYRRDRADPRVVISQFNHYGPEGARTAPSHITWLQIAANIRGFLAMLIEAR
jgi:hypothetical protein